MPTEQKTNPEVSSTPVDKQAETAVVKKETQTQLQGAEASTAATQAKEKLQAAFPFETANVLPGTKHTFEYIKNTSLSKDIVTATKTMPGYENLSDEQRVEKFSDNIDKIWFLAIDTIIDNPDISQAEIRNMASGTSIAFMKWYNGSDANTKKTLDDFLKYGIGQVPTDSSDKKSFLGGLGGVFGNLFRGFGANANFKNFINKNMLVAKSVDRLGKSSFLSSPEVYSQMLDGVFGKQLSDESSVLEYIEKYYYDKKFSPDQLVQEATKAQPDIKLTMEQTGANMTPEMLQRLNGLGKYFQTMESGKNTIKNMLSKSPILDILVGNLYAISTGQPLSGPLSWLGSNPMGQEIMNTLKPIASVAMPLMNYVFKFMGYKTDMPAGTNLQDWAKAHPYGAIEGFLNDRSQNYLLSAEARDRVSTGLTDTLKTADSGLRTGTIFSDIGNLAGKLDSDFVLALNRKLNIDFSDAEKTKQQVFHFFSDSGKFFELKKSIPDGYLKNDQNPNLYDLNKISLLTKWYLMDWAESDKSKTFEEFVKSKQQAVDPKTATDDPDAKKPVETQPFSLAGTENDDEDNASAAAQSNASQDESTTTDTNDGVDASEADGVSGEKLTLEGASYISNAKTLLRGRGINKIPKFDQTNNPYIATNSKNVPGGINYCTRYVAYRVGLRGGLTGNGNLMAQKMINERGFLKMDYSTLRPGTVVSVPPSHVCIVEQVDRQNGIVITSGMNEGNQQLGNGKTENMGMITVRKWTFAQLKSLNAVFSAPRNNTQNMKDFVSTGQEFGLLTKTSDAHQPSVDLPVGNLKYKYEGLAFEKPAKFKAALDKINTDGLVNKIYNTWAKKYGTNVAKRAVIIASGESSFDPNEKAGGNEDSRGLFQINLGVHASEVGKMAGINSSNKPALRAWLRNPDNNIKFAMQLFEKSGKDFSDWTYAHHDIQTGSTRNGNWILNIV